MPEYVDTIITDPINEETAVHLWRADKEQHDLIWEKSIEEMKDIFDAPDLDDIRANRLSDGTYLFFIYTDSSNGE